MNLRLAWSSQRYKARFISPRSLDRVLDCCKADLHKGPSLSTTLTGTVNIPQGCGGACLDVGGRHNQTRGIVMNAVQVVDCHHPNTSQGRYLVSGCGRFGSGFEVGNEASSARNEREQEGGYWQRSNYIGRLSCIVDCRDNPTKHTASTRCQQGGYYTMSDVMQHEELLQGLQSYRHNSVRYSRNMGDSLSVGRNGL